MATPEGTKRRDAGDGVRERTDTVASGQKGNGGFPLAASWLLS